MLQLLYIVAHESSREILCLAALLICEYDKLEAAVHIFKNLFSILEAEQAGDFRIVKEHLPQLLCALQTVNAGWNDDTTTAAFTKQIKALLGEELVEIYFP